MSRTGVSRAFDERRIRGMDWECHSNHWRHYAGWRMTMQNCGQCRWRWDGNAVSLRTAA